ncbi:hypothetical protein BpHYR1_026759 [Brachionus plicatilis]|uniref:Uncharacterized protein n=1 Tax=Brachionus plicatilis TaxID=10195 RepID=A0A3M7R1G1_BRAPC|nr:hypothetical protein BpHYR1_026759 [Brachionus plicatilis]
MIYFYNHYFMTQFCRNTRKCLRPNDDDDKFFCTQSERLFMRACMHAACVNFVFCYWDIIYEYFFSNLTFNNKVKFILSINEYTKIVDEKKFN